VSPFHGIAPYQSTFTYLLTYLLPLDSNRGGELADAGGRRASHGGRAVWKAVRRRPVSRQLAVGAARLRRRRSVQAPARTHQLLGARSTRRSARHRPSQLQRHSRDGHLSVQQHLLRRQCTHGRTEKHGKSPGHRQWLKCKLRGGGTVDSGSGPAAVVTGPKRSRTDFTTMQHLGPVPSSRVKLTRRLTFDLTLG